MLGMPRVINEILSPYGCKTIWQIGHCRWKIENHAFKVQALGRQVL
jgi:hypothetical protein